MLMSPADLGHHLEARHPIVRATAGAVLAIHTQEASSPESAFALAHRAVAAATESGDRGLLVTTLAARAAAECRRGLFTEALESYAEAQPLWSGSTAGDRRDWASSPIALSIVCGRAAALARSRPEGAGLIAEILADILLLLLFAIRRGCSLVVSVAGVVLQWAITGLAAMFVLDDGPEARF
jgi:hypothetical protein